MAAYMRSVICLVAIERHPYATRGKGFIVESKRYVRGMRRKPVRVLFPENETDKVLKASPHAQPAVQNVKSERGVNFAAKTRRDAESVFAKERSNMHSSVKDPHVTVTKDQIDGLRFERAFPGDKRLG